MKITVEVPDVDLVESITELEYDQIIDVIRKVELYVGDCEFTEKLLDYLVDLEEEYDKDCTQVSPE